MIAQIDRQIEDIELGRWSMPRLMQAENKVLSVALSQKSSSALCCAYRGLA